VSSIQNAVAKRNENQPTLGQVIQRMVPEIQRALPRHMSGDRMARLALTVLRKDPALAKTTPESFAGALLTAAGLGLEPGVNNEAYLVAYGRECQLIIGYQGFAKLFWQHPLAAHLDAQAVHENDEFDYAYGLNPFLTHKPAKGDRGKVTEYYAVAKLSTGASAFVVLSADDVKKLRGGKVGTSGKIADPMHWMERKTAVRQLVKLLPKSSEMDRAIRDDERGGAELHRERVLEREVLDGNTPPAIENTPDAGPTNTETGEVLTGELVDDNYNDAAWMNGGGQA
jgi:recombination protein RecT